MDSSPRDTFIGYYHNFGKDKAALAKIRKVFKSWDISESKVSEVTALAGGAGGEGGMSPETPEQLSEPKPIKNSASDITNIPKPDAEAGQSVKEYLGNNGDDMYYYLVTNPSDDGEVGKAEVVDANGKVVYPVEGQEVDSSDMAKFIMDASDVVEVTNLSYDIVAKYIIPPEEAEINQEEKEEKEERAEEVEEPNGEGAGTETPKEENNNIGIQGTSATPKESVDPLLAKFGLNENIEDEIERFEEIIDEIEELTNEALECVPRGMVKERAEAYWYGQIMAALNRGGYERGSMHSMEDTLKELESGEANESKARELITKFKLGESISDDDAFRDAISVIQGQATNTPIDWMLIKPLVTDLYDYVAVHVPIESKVSEGVSGLLQKFGLSEAVNEQGEEDEEKLEDEVKKDVPADVVVPEGEPTGDVASGEVPAEGAPEGEAPAAPVDGATATSSEPTGDVMPASTGGVDAGGVMPAEPVSTEPAISADPVEAAKAQISVDYPEEPLTSTAMAYADSFIDDPKVYGAIRNRNWEGVYTNDETFLKQAKIVGDYNVFTPTVAKVVTDKFGNGAKYKLARDGSVAVFITVRDTDKQHSIEAIKDLTGADKVELTGNPGEIKIWWN